MHQFRAERGQAVVEFVLLFPFVLVLIMSLVEFGFAFHAFVTINNAASEAARYAAVGNEPSASSACETGSPLSIEGRAVEMSAGLITCAEVSVQYTKIVPEPGYARGDAVSVHVAHTYTMITPLGALLSMVSGGTIPTTLTMGACSDSRLERTPSDQSLLVAGTGCS